MILEKSTSRRDLPKMQMNWNSQNVNSEDQRRVGGRPLGLKGRRLSLRLRPCRRSSISEATVQGRRLLTAPVTY